MKPPLNAALVSTNTDPAPVKMLPALKVLSPPPKRIVPVCASIVPLLMKPIWPMVVMPVPALLRNVPLLVKLVAAPPLKKIPLSLWESHSD